MNEMDKVENHLLKLEINKKKVEPLLNPARDNPPLYKEPISSTSF
jgi:hypothetical protein